MKNSIPRRPYIPKGCDQQGRYPQASNAPCEGEEWKHDPFWWITDVVIAVSLTAVVLFLLILFGLIP